LRELTQELLESPVGSLFCQSGVESSSSKNDDRDEAYALARESGELVEYLLRGFNCTIGPLTLCSNDKVSATNDFDPDEVSSSLETMMDVMERFHQEGEMYLRLRQEALDYSAGVNSDSSDGGSSSSASSNSEKNEADARDQQRSQLRSGNNDFAAPGVTIAMYDTILDAMACATHVSLEGQSANASSESASFLQMLEPDDVYRVAGAALKAHDLNNQFEDGDMFFSPTTPTMVTYNAALRGIGNICLSETSIDERKGEIIDQGLAHGFGVYNHLTHNEHGLPKRNAASIIYLLKIIQACIPPSRTRGNMTVALWHQASMEGLVTPELIECIKKLHDNSNGPEFDVFLESLDKCTTSADEKQNKVIITPQRFARFAKKYSHSKFY
jgi:hypothetical protein